MEPFGDKRNEVVERLIALKKRYPNFVVNGVINALAKKWKRPPN